MVIQGDIFLEAKKQGIKKGKGVLWRLSSKEEKEQKGKFQNPARQKRSKIMEGSTLPPLPHTQKTNPKQVVCKRK